MTKRDDLRQVDGFNLRLRLVTPADAEYIFELRTNPDYNAHVSSVTGTAADQRAWIESYQSREQQGVEYYYVIERLDSTRCGVVRLYEITDHSFTWGSWFLDHNKPPKAALESTFLIYQIAFDMLQLDKAIFDVRKENEHTLTFHRRFGATETGADDIDIFFEYNKTQFDADRNNYVPILESAAVGNV